MMPKISIILSLAKNSTMVEAYIPSYSILPKLVFLAHISKLMGEDVFECSSKKPYLLLQR
jgi:hypothetical protein